MALSCHNLARRASVLGYKGLSGDGYLELSDDQGSTTGYASIYKITGLDLSHLTSDSFNWILRSFKNFLKSTKLYSEIISVPIPNHSHEQKTYWNHDCMEALYHQIQKDKDVSKQTKVRFNDIADILKKQKKEDKSTINKQFYLVLFAKHKKNLFQAPVSPLFNEFLKPMSIKNKLALLSYLNFNIKIGQAIENSPKHPDPKTVIYEDAILPNPINKLNFHSNFIKVGKYYVTFLNFQFLRRGKTVPAFWLNVLMSSMKNTINFFSIDGHLGLTPFNVALDKIHLGKHALHQMSLHTLIYDTSVDALMKDIKRFHKATDMAFGFNNIIGRQPQKEAVKDIFKPVNEQNHTRLISFENLVKSYPCHFSQLRDPCGEVFGTTHTDGEFCFAPFQTVKNQWTPHARNRNFSIILGNPGMGKSTLAKMLCMDAFDRGKYVYNFDMTGEYQDFTKSSGGKVVNFSDGKHYINPLDLIHVYSQNKYGEVNENLNQFYKNLDRIVGIVGILNHNVSAESLSYLKHLLSTFYSYCFHYPHDNFPIFSDLLKFLQKKTKHVHDTKSAYMLGTLVSAIKGIINKYGKYLNHHTYLGNLKGIKCVDFSYVGPVRDLSRRLCVVDIIDGLSLMAAVATKSDQQYYFNIDEADHVLSYNTKEALPFLKIKSLYQLFGPLLRSHSSLTLEVFNLNNMILHESTGNQNIYMSILIEIINFMQYWHLFNLAHTPIGFLRLILSATISPNIYNVLKCAQNLNAHQVLTFIPSDYGISTPIQWSVHLTQYQMKRFLN